MAMKIWPYSVRINGVDIPPFVAYMETGIHRYGCPENWYVSFKNKYVPEMGQEYVDLLEKVNGDPYAFLQAIEDGVLAK